MPDTAVTISQYCACCSSRIGEMMSYTKGANRYCLACDDPTNIDFQVDFGGETKTFKSFDEAAGFAVVRAASRFTSEGPGFTSEGLCIDVLCYTRAAAHSFGCLEEFDRDPEASVTCRLRIKVADEGSVA